MKRRLIALLLCICMLSSMTVYATDDVTEPTSEPTVPTTVGDDALGVPESSDPTVPETSAPASEPTVPETSAPASEPTVPETSAPASEPTVPETSAPAADPTEPSQVDVPAGPAVGDTIYIKSGSLTYKAADESSAKREVVFNYKTKIVSIVTDELGNAAWYEFEPTGWLLFYKDYKFVKVENTTITDPDTSEPTEPSKPEETEKEALVDGKAIAVTGEIPETVKLTAAAVDFTPNTLSELGIASEVVQAYDITLLNEDGTEWQPDEGKTVEVSLSVGEISNEDYEGFLNVVHVHDGQIRHLGEFEVVDGQLTFETDGFSTFYTYVEILRGGYSYMIVPGKQQTISLKDLMADMGYVRNVKDEDGNTIPNEWEPNFYCVKSVKSSDENVIKRTAWGNQVPKKNDVKAYEDATLTVYANKEFTGYVELEVQYHSTQARYEHKNAESKYLYTRVLRLYCGKVEVDTLNDVLKDDGVNVHLFNYGAAINDSENILKTNGSGFLPFSHGGYDYFPNVDQRFQYYKTTTNADGTSTTELANSYENMSEIDGEAVGNSYAAIMSKTLKNGYPHIKSDVEKDSSPTIKSGSLKYLFDIDKDFVKGSGGLTTYSALGSIWDGATKRTDISKNTSNDGYVLNDNNTYQSKHFVGSSEGSGLFRNVDGYYYYNSANNAAYFDADAGRFVLYDKTIVPKYTISDNRDGNTTDKTTGNFLPFNELTEYTIGNVDTAIAYANYIKGLNDQDDDNPDNDGVNNPNGTEAKTYRTDWPAEGADAYLLHTDNDSRIDLWFGMSADYEFYMPEGGKIYNTTTGEYDDMVYQFTGDDDVWVYIDDVLLLDIGGCHAPYTGNINFATGEVTYRRSLSEAPATEDTPSYEDVVTTMYDLYVDAYAELSDEEKASEMGAKIKDIIDNGFVTLENGNKIFKNYTIHTFDFFYLERGGNISSMEMKFNLEPIPDASLIVEKQTENVNPVFDNLEYTFKVTAKDSSDHLKTGLTYTIDNQPYEIGENGTFTLTRGKAAVFNSIEFGDKITVEEISTGDYTTTCNVVSAEGTTTGTTSSGEMQFTPAMKNYSVAFLNTFTTYNLSVGKKLINDCNAPVAEGLKYPVTVTIDGAPYTGSGKIGTDTVAIENGVVELENGQIVLIEKIPLSYTYGVEESTIPDAASGFKYLTPKYQINDSEASETAPDSMTATANTMVTVTNELKQLFGNLKITKTGIDPLDHHEENGVNKEEAQSTIYTVSGTSYSGETVNLEVVIVGNDSVTINHLPVGEYTVKEKTDWAWRYELTDETNKRIKEVQEDQTAETTYNNKRTKVKWLSGDSYCSNWWGGTSGTVSKRS